MSKHNDLQEILDRDDVKQHIRKLEVQMKYKYAERYSAKLLIFASFQSWWIVFHYGVMKDIQKDYGLHANQFMALCGASILARQWNCKNVFGRSSLYKGLMESCYSEKTMREHLNKLVKLRFMYPVAQTGLSNFEWVMLKKHKRPYEKLYRIEAKGDAIIESYTKRIQKKVQEYWKHHGEFSYNYRKALSFVINHRLDLAGADEHVKQLMLKLPLELLQEKQGSNKTNLASLSKVG